MFKKSYFLKWGSPPQTAFSDVPLTSQHPLEKAHVVAPSSAPFTKHTGITLIAGLHDQIHTGKHR
jgi:hypothetical protein